MKASGICNVYTYIMIRAPFRSPHLSFFLSNKAWIRRKLFMGSFKLKKTTKHKRSKHHDPTIESLPKDLWTEVLALVASASFIDLFSAKLSCKDFHRIAEEDYIFEHVSLNKFYAIPWNQNAKASSFFERCKESGNPELLYREGMTDYFSHGRTESGFEYLKRATEKRHVETT